MDAITEDIAEETPWAMLFADDIALSGESCDQVKGGLELWRARLEGVGVKLSRKKLNTYRHLENRRTSS